MTDDHFGKPVPCPRGASYHPLINMPRVPRKPREPTPEQRAEKKLASERNASAAAAIHNQLLLEGMQAYAEAAHQKWLRAGGYGSVLTPEEQQQIRDAGFEPAPPDR